MGANVLAQRTASARGRRAAQMQWHSMLASAIVKQEKCRTVSVCFAVRWSYHPQAYDAKWGSDSLSAPHDG